MRDQGRICTEQDEEQNHFYPSLGKKSKTPPAKHLTRTEELQHQAKETKLAFTSFAFAHHTSPAPLSCQRLQNQNEVSDSTG